MSGRSSSTLGYERATNPYLDPNLSREDFVEMILGSVPLFPPYYRRMKALNSQGPKILEGLPGNRELSLDEFVVLRDSGAVVMDLRVGAAFGRGHVPDAFGIGANGYISVWSSWLIPYETPILMVTDSDADRETAIRHLIRVGLDDVRGTLAGGMKAWISAGLPVAGLSALSVSELERRLGQVVVVDVRAVDEFAAGHIAGARHAFLGTLEDAVDTLPRDTVLALTCRTGYRSTIAGSVLQRHGFDQLLNIAGGMEAWQGAGYDVVRGVE